MNHFLDFDYFQFVWDFVSLGKPLFKQDKSEKGLICLQFAIRFVFDMIQKVKETGIFIQWMPLLDQMFAENIQASTWLVN